MRVRALVIANAGDADPGFMGHELRGRGFTLTEAHRERTQEWPELAGFDLVLTLGSEWSVYWPHVSRPVAAEKTLVGEVHARRVPLLGICFGQQVMAAALGGAVLAATEPEIGWLEVDSDDHRSIAPGPWLQWHGDVVTVPPGATELARSPVGPQAWRIDRSVGTQFHPEATETMLARWTATAEEELAIVGLTPQAMMDATRAHVEVAAANAARLVGWFCEEVCGDR